MKKKYYILLVIVIFLVAGFMPWKCQIAPAIDLELLLSSEKPITGITGIRYITDHPYGSPIKQFFIVPWEGKCRFDNWLVEMTFFSRIWIFIQNRIAGYAFSKPSVAIMLNIPKHLKLNLEMTGVISINHRKILSDMEQHVTDYSVQDNCYISIYKDIDNVEEPYFVNFYDVDVTTQSVRLYFNEVEEEPKENPESQ